MTPELVGILSVGAAQAALTLTLWRHLGGRIDRLEDRFEARFEALEARIDTLSERVARIEGVIEGLFAGMNGRRTAQDKEAAA